MADKNEESGKLIKEEGDAEDYSRDFYVCLERHEDCNEMWFMESYFHLMNKFLESSKNEEEAD